MGQLAVCPGCGLALPRRRESSDLRFRATWECWELYGELAAYTIARRDPSFLHQHGVDAYQAQHAGDGLGSMGAAFSLIGLYMAVEKGATGLQVQRAHMHLGKTKRKWPAFEAPGKLATLTVQDVLNAEPGERRDAMLMKWCAAVWESWRHAHEWTRAACDELLADSFSVRVRSR